MGILIINKLESWCYMKTSERNAKRLFKFMKLVPIALILGLVVLIAFNYENITVENIVSFAPDNRILAFLVIMALYTVKSLSVIFPTAVLYISSGKIFSLKYGLLVNFLGLTIVLALPYFIGRLYGRNLVDEIYLKYPKALKINEFKDQAQWFFVSLTRMLKFLPGDIMSMLHGAIETDFLTYMVFSMAFRLPPMVANTFLGQAVKSKNFKGFFISTAITVILSLTTSGIYLYKRSLSSN